MIEETWGRLERRLRVDGAGEQLISNMRQAFVGGLYVAAATLGAGGTTKQVSETAFKIENQK